MNGNIFRAHLHINKTFVNVTNRISAYSFSELKKLVFFNLISDDIYGELCETAIRSFPLRICRVSFRKLF